MVTVQDLLDSKGPSVLTIGEDATVLQAVELMNDHQVGSVVVATGGGSARCRKVAGIFTERDVLRRVVGEMMNPADVYVGDVMTREVAVCRPDQPLDEIAAIMQQQRIRHLPVVDDAGHLHGLISIGDVNACHATEQQQHIHFLNDYIYGRA